ncbi:hypothetical protein A6V39_03825 [Candidatus Mycoplasma haematobovis]|uniref:Uncharacterized protein n=1 Tax=Candidatus Mycoplasma haematobovis TaxID=432608 RepID=A0A1A9QDI0_9MOLU|nr:hypothetical protein [Candidatus Mycoplasma haematobovis]OAL10016.1 hypothetical protein A6V39_03825 [Candidatus Mycoplasma haematobovis]
MSGKKKALIATLSAGALGGTSTGVYYSVDKSSYIDRKLRSEGFQILTDYDNNDNDWTPVLNKYKTARKNVRSNSANETLPKLKKKCNIAISNRSSNNEDYLFARQWCVKEETVTTILSRGKYKVLNSNESKNLDNDDWNNRIQLVLNSKDEYKELKTKLQNEADSNRKIAIIRKECADMTNSQKTTTTEDFGERFEKSRILCAIKKKDNT